MSQTLEWQPTDPDLLVVSQMLDAAFCPDRALASGALVTRVTAALPVQSQVIHRLARLLTGMIFLAATGAVGLLAVLVHAEGGVIAPALAVKLWTSMGAISVSVLLTVAAPRLAAWDHALWRRLAGVHRQAGVADVVLIRAGAMVLLVCSMTIWLG